MKIKDPTSEEMLAFLLAQPCRSEEDREEALAAAGDGAWWRPDYSEMQYGSGWFVAIICVPDTVRAMAV
jgi:hypothetical protein